MIPVSVSAGVIDFPDPGLNAAIRKAIGKPSGDIQDADLVGLTSLVVNNQGVVNLEGIQHCVDLRTLDLLDNQISDISALVGLTNLTELRLDDNQISDLSALAGLTNLTVLWLDNNQISDISALAGLTNLTVLWLFNNQISGIKPLVNNPGIDNRDDVGLRYNFLDLTPESPEMLDIEGRIQLASATLATGLTG